MHNKGAVAWNAKYNNLNFIGQKFGRLIVLAIERRQNGKYLRWMWECKCECGDVRWYRGEYVWNGHTSSCGCFSRDHQNALKHGESGTRLFTIWSHMCIRCDPSKKDDVRNRRYAGREIKVCDEWHDYTVFAKWAKENGYNDSLTIERIDNDGDYCPENCKWISKPKQARNRGTTFHVTYNGRDMSLAEACELAGMPYKQVFARIKYMSWPVDKALSVPINETRKWKRNERFCKL